MLYHMIFLIHLPIGPHCPKRSTEAWHPCRGASSSPCRAWRKWICATTCCRTWETYGKSMENMGKHGENMSKTYGKHGEMYGEDMENMSNIWGNLWGIYGIIWGNVWWKYGEDMVKIWGKYIVIWWHGQFLSISGEFGVDNHMIIWMNDGRSHQFWWELCGGPPRNG